MSMLIAALIIGGIWGVFALAFVASVALAARKPMPANENHNPVIKLNEKVIRQGLVA